MYYIRVDNRGIEPRPSACKTDVLPLTPVAQRVPPENRTQMLRVAAAAMTIIAEQSCSSENRTQLAYAYARVLQTPLCPSTQAAEEGGVEPPACRPAPVSSGSGALAPHLPERKVKESNPRPYDRHGFLDRLRTVPRYPPKLLPQDSNLERVVQSHLCCRYTREYWQRTRDSNPRSTVLETDWHNLRCPIWLDRDSNPSFQVMSLTWDLSTIEQSLASGSNRRT